jgi:hypothetical protein
MGTKEQANSPQDDPVPRQDRLGEDLPQKPK